MPECPHCMKTSPLDEFDETEIGCEDCGSHEALKCPKCDELIDLVYNEMEADK